MIGRTGSLRALLASALLCAVLAGCSDGIEVQSKLLDNIGGAIGGGSHREPQLAERPGLVIPPPMAALPEPGTGAVVAAQVNAQLPKGPEQMAAAAAGDKKKKEAEACKLAAANRKDPDLQAACPGLIAKLTAPSPDDSAQ